MAKINREYTGLERTPSSMAWLIEKRRSLKGQVDRVRRQLAEAQRKVAELPRQLVALETDLAHLDGVFKLHDVEVQPSGIKGKQTRRKALLPYGVLTKQILKILREADKPVLTSVIAAGVDASLDEPLGWRHSAYLRHRTSRRLKDLVADGAVRRHHVTVPGTQDEGSWSLVRQVNPETQDAPPLLRVA
jgi:hypothetical protein